MATGGIATFNVNHGFAEALVRGFRSGFLTDSDYSRIQQSESLDDIKMNLKADTDYMGFLDNDTELSPALIQTRAVEKLVDEFDYLEGQVRALESERAPQPAARSPQPASPSAREADPPRRPHPPLATPSRRADDRRRRSRSSTSFSTSATST